MPDHGTQTKTPRARQSRPLANFLCRLCHRCCSLSFWDVRHFLVNEASTTIFSDSLSIAFTAHPVNRSIVPLLSQQEQILKRWLTDARPAGEQQPQNPERMKALTSNLNQLMSPLIKQGLVMSHSPSEECGRYQREWCLSAGEASLQAECRSWFCNRWRSC